MSLDRATLEAVAEIHAAILSPDGWEPAMASLLAAFRGDHAICMARGRIGDPDPNTHLSLGIGLDPSAFSTLVSPRAMELAEPFYRLVRPGQATSTADVMSDDQVMRTDLYQEFIRPVGGLHALTLYDLPPHNAFHATLCRKRKGRPFTASDVARLQALGPTLSAAFELRSRLAHYEGVIHDLTAVLGCLNEGVVLVGPDGHPVFANAAAHALLTARDGLRCDGAGLAGITAAATQRLRTALDDVTRRATPAPIRISLPRHQRRLPLAVTIFPIARLGAPVGGLPRASAVLFVRDTDGALPMTPDALADLFGLTPREADLALDVARGRSLAQAAGTLGMGLGTAQQHMKRVYEKVGVHNRAALVACIRSVAGG